MSVTLPPILRTRPVGDADGITSVCTAHPLMVDGRVRPLARDLVLASVTLVLERHSSACGLREA